MNRLLRLTALMLMVVVAIAAVRIPSAVAQESPETSAFDDVTNLEGLESATSRSYTLDYETLFSTPANMESAEMPEGLQVLSLGIYKFDNDDNAKSAMDLAREELEAEGALGVENVEEFDADDMNDDSIALNGSSEEEGVGPTKTTALVTQEGQYIYFAVSLASGEESDSQTPAVDAVKYMKDTDEGGDVAFNEDGTSTGGTWEKFIKSDNEQVAGLIAFDQQIFPVEEGA